MILPKCRVFCQIATVLQFSQEYFVFNQHDLKLIEIIV